MERNIVFPILNFTKFIWRFILFVLSSELSRFVSNKSAKLWWTGSILISYYLSQCQHNFFQKSLNP